MKKKLHALAAAKSMGTSLNNFLLLLMGMLLLLTLNVKAQNALFPCDRSTLTNSNGYYGGFQAGGTNGINNFAEGAASTDYIYGNGQTQYQILSNSMGQSGYLPLLPHSGSFFLSSHTSSSQPDLRLWYKTLSVTPGQQLQVCAWIANLKENPVGGFPINIVINTTINTVSIKTPIAANSAVTNEWVQISGTYTVPMGITSIDVEIKDPTPSFNGSSHFLALDDIAISNITAAGGPLPISLLDFTATKQNKVVALNWQTSTEQSSSYFEVEFSRDGSKFENIGSVKAAGSSSSAKNYTLIHNTPVNGVNYYRLKSVDADGSFKYSTVRVVKYSTTKTINIMPNPTEDRVYITSNEAGMLQSVGVYSINGKLLQQVNNFAMGKSIDLSTYAPSIYILKLMDKDGNTEVIKVVRK